MFQTNLAFKVGQTVEVRSFEIGYRGAWFRCKILRIYTVKGKLYYSLEYLDYDEEEIHQTQVFQRFEDEEKEWVMVRPPYPPVYHESEVHKIEADEETLVVVHGSWKVGDLVDWQKDDCYWSGRVLAMKKNKRLQFELYPPPRGEGETYEALSKDLRPSLEWSLEDGWTLPPMDGRRRQCARLVNKKKNLLQPICNRDNEDVCQTKKQQTETAKKQKTEMVKKQKTDIATQKLKGNGEIRLNIDESDSIEAAVYDLEELIVRIEWIKKMLKPDVREGSWKYENYCPSSTGM